MDLPMDLIAIYRAQHFLVISLVTIVTYSGSNYISCILPFSQHCIALVHKSCTELPRKKWHPLYRHSLTLLPKSPYYSRPFWCIVYGLHCNGFTYNCDRWKFDLDVQCSLTLDILTHKGHQHRLLLSSTPYLQSCNSCGSERNQVFCCISCEFALDYKCATLPQTTRYKQYEHPFTLCYTSEDDSSEYYWDICEEERNSRNWFYYCGYCSYLAHPECILG